MAETINLRKRLIGVEDINFDITGTNEKETFFTSVGGQQELSKINASHFPLTRNTREKLNATNVDEALVLLSDKVDDFEVGNVLEEDTTISFDADADAETIQNIINQQKKNLNGHTLTFLFPVSIAQNLYAPFVWQDFFNGTVIIAGGTEGRKISVYDKQDINSLFKIYRCQCEVRIEHFYFVHQYSSYAVSVESSSAVILKDCQFSGVKTEETYAVHNIAGNAAFVECEFYEDLEIFPPVSNDGIGKHLGEIFAYPGAVPPEGAYLLNGQTIDGCNELYPEFWEWLTTAGVRSVDNDTYETELAATGVCGGFVINSASGSVRLPSVVNGTLWGADISNIGQSLAAGLPNIEGSLTATIGNGGAGDGALSASYYSAGRTSGGGNYFYQDISFDASKSNSVYGKSDTVQPQAVRVSWCIQVYNAATALSEQESAQLASLLQVKAGGDNIRKEAAMRIWESEEQTITNSTLYQLTHNLTLTDEEIRKARARVVLKCVTAEHGYQAGDIISDFSDGIANQGDFAVTPTVRSNTIAFRKAPGSFVVIPLSEAYWKYLTNANWKMIFQIFY